MEMLPSEFVCWAMMCWQRLRDWQQAGVWEQLHATLVSKLRRREQLDWSLAVVDSSPVRAGLGEKTGPNPTDRRSTSSKHHPITGAQRIALASIVTGAMPTM